MLDDTQETIFLAILESGKGVGFAAFSLGLDSKELGDFLMGSTALLKKARSSINLGIISILSSRKKALAANEMNKAFQYDYLQQRFVVQLNYYAYANTNKEYMSDGEIIGLYKVTYSLFEVAYALGYEYDQFMAEISVRASSLKSEIERLDNAFKNKFV